METRSISAVREAASSHFSNPWLHVRWYLSANLSAHLRFFERRLKKRRKRKRGIIYIYINGSGDSRLHKFPRFYLRVSRARLRSQRRKWRCLHGPVPIAPCKSNGEKIGRVGVDRPRAPPLSPSLPRRSPSAREGGIVKGYSEPRASVNSVVSRHRFSPFSNSNSLESCVIIHTRINSLLNEPK